MGFECECLPKCPFYHDMMERMPAMAELFKQNYCLGDSANCARHMIFERLGSGAVPTNLYPNDIEGAQAVLG